MRSIASRALGITLTKRGKHLGQDIPMCGVPVHAADDYLQKLISLGFRVAVCEQTEDPAEAKKRGSKSVVRRDVTRLVTPGTIDRGKAARSFAVEFSDGAVGRVKGAGEARFGLAWIDISTGAFHVGESRPARLLADIARVEPRELILAEAVFDDEELRPLIDQLGRARSPQPAVLFDSATAEDRIARFFERRFARRFRQLLARRTGGGGGGDRLCRETQISERPALGRPERERDGSTVVHRSGDAGQSGTGAHAVG
jgi:DNA mismatch repair protein MutS